MIVKKKKTYRNNHSHRIKRTNNTKTKVKRNETDRQTDGQTDRQTDRQTDGLQATDQRKAKQPAPTSSARQRNF